MSYNFAVDQYQGNPNKPNTDRSASPGGSTQYPSPSPSHNVNLLGLSGTLKKHILYLKKLWVKLFHRMISNSVRV